MSSLNNVNYFRKAVNDIKRSVNENKKIDFTYNKRVAEELERQGFDVKKVGEFYRIDKVDKV